MTVNSSNSGGGAGGTVTANAGTNLNTSALALEAGNLAAIAASLAIVDDWDESDRNKVNPIVGQAGVAAGAGAVGATVPRVTLASDDPGVASLATLAGAIASARSKISASTSWAYTALSDVTITLASLATSSTLVAGRQATAISTAGYEDIIVAGKLTVGTTPTIATRIEVWCVGTINGTTWPDTVTGSDAAITWTTAGIKTLSCRQVAFLDVLATTSDISFPIPLTSVKTIFESLLPSSISFVVVHNTGVNLNSTGGNQAIQLTGVRKVLGA